MKSFQTCFLILSITPLVSILEGMEPEKNNVKVILESSLSQSTKLEVCANPFISLTNSELRGLRLSCRFFNDLILQHYRVCQPIYGLKQHVPLLKAENFQSLTLSICEEFKNDRKYAIGEPTIAFAYFRLGELYWQGLRSHPKYYKALECYLQAYRRGSKEAAMKLASIYRSGLRYKEKTIISKNAPRSAKLFVELEVLTLDQAFNYCYQQGLKAAKARARKRQRYNKEELSQNNNPLVTLLTLPIEILLPLIDSLSTVSLLNLRSVCHTLDAIIIKEYAICQTVTGRKECVPHKKATYFRHCTQRLQEEFKEAKARAAIKARARNQSLYASLYYYQLGELYWDGLRKAPDHLQALFYYGEAYRRHFPGAILKLGLIYDEGIIVTQNSEQAIKLYRQYQGDAPDYQQCENASQALYYLGINFATGYQKAEEEKKKIDLLSSAASLGHVQALLKLGQAYYHSQKEGRNLTLAIDYFEKAGKLGCCKAYDCLAQIYYEKNDIPCAIEYYKKAIQLETGDEIYGSRYGLTKIYLQHRNLNNKYLQKAAKLLKGVSKRSNWVNYYLGKLYLKGLGVERDTEKGIAFLREAITDPNKSYGYDLKARKFLGIAYYKGKITQKNDREATKLLNYDFFFYDSHFKVFLYKAKMLCEGRWYDEATHCSRQDLHQGVSLLIRLANRNYAKAQFYLAQHMLKLPAAAQYRDRAIALLEAASKQGYAKATTMLQSIRKIDCIENMPI